MKVALVSNLVGKKELDHTDLHAVLALGCATAIGVSTDAVTVGLKIMVVAIKTNRPSLASTCAMVLPLLQHTLDMFVGCLGHLWALR